MQFCQTSFIRWVIVYRILAKEELHSLKKERYYSGVEIGIIISVTIILNAYSLKNATINNFYFKLSGYEKLRQVLVIEKLAGRLTCD